MSLFVELGQLTVLWPRMLWLYALLPLLAGVYLWFVARQRRTRLALAGLAGLNAGAMNVGRTRRVLPPLIFFVALIALIGAVARPHAVVVLPSMHKDIILAIDISGSMRATDIKPNRLRAAQDAARTFVENQPRHTRIGLVTVAGGASVVQSPTDNREDLFKRSSACSFSVARHSAAASTSRSRPCCQMPASISNTLSMANRAGTGRTSTTKTRRRRR